MVLLIVGLTLWCVVHLIPALVPKFRTAMRLKLGENGYKGIFSLAMVSAILLIVFGWRSTSPQFLFDLGKEVHWLALSILPISIYLFVVAKSNSQVKRWIRHPQLTGLILWAAAHLLLNGDSRSLVLFGALGLWALLEIVLINRREGIWIKSQAPAFRIEAINLLIALVVTALLVFAHPYIAGVPVVA